MQRTSTRGLAFFILAVGLFWSGDARAEFVALVRIEVDGTLVEGNYSGYLPELDPRQWIEILALGGGVSVPTSIDTGGGGGTGSPVLRPVSFVKHWDSASPFLYQAIVGGLRVNAEFRFYRRGGAGNYEDFFTILLENGYFSNVAPSASTSSDGPPRETWSIAVGRIRWEDPISGTEFSYDVTTGNYK